MVIATGVSTHLPSAIHTGEIRLVYCDGFRDALVVDHWVFHRLGLWCHRTMQLVDSVLDLSNLLDFPAMNERHRIRCAYYRSVRIRRQTMHRRCFEGEEDARLFRGGRGCERSFDVSGCFEGLYRQPHGLLCRNTLCCTITRYSQPQLVEGQMLRVFDRALATDSLAIQVLIGRIIRGIILRCLLNR